MAAVILTSEHTSNSDIDYKVEIENTLISTGTSNTFVTVNVNISYHPEVDNITSPIIPSTAEIVCWNQGGYFNSTFIPDLILNQQEKYRVKVYQDKGSGYELFWFGFVLQDQVEEIEASQPRQFVLKCADGFGRLQDKDFLHPNEATTVPQRTSFKDLIINALGDTGLTGVFGANADYLVTSCDWWENTMTYGATSDPLAVSFIDINIFRIKGEDGSETKYTSSYDVLAQIATVWNCRVYQSGGKWRFEQIGQRVTSTLKENVYRLNGTQNSATSTATYESSVGTNTSLLSARSANNNETFLPAAKYVNINYDQAFLTNEIGQYKFDSTSSTEFEIGTIEGLNEVGLNVLVSYFAYATVTLGAALKKHRATFKILLTLEEQDGTKHYYNNSNGGSWDTTLTTYTFNTQEVKPYTELTFIAAGNFSLVTQPLPANGEISLRIYLDDFYVYERSSGSWISTALSNEAWSIYSSLEIDGENQNVTGAVYSSINNNSAIGDDETIDLGNVNIGDSLFATGRVMVDNGGTYEKTSDWRVGNSGSYTQSILQLLCDETLSYFDTPIEVYDGDIYNSDSYQYRLNWDGKYYLPLSTSFSTNQGIWSGRWFVISQDRSNVVGQTKYEKRKQLFRRVKANVNESELPNGMIGGTQFDEGSGQFEEIIEYEITPALMLAGITSHILVAAGGSGTYIVPTKVLLVKTDGTTNYGSGAASVYFASETTNVIDSAQFLTAINTGLTMQFNATDSTKFFENADLLLNISSDPTGDYEYTLKVYYKLITL